MKFQLGVMGFEADRSKIKEQVYKYLRQSNLDWNGAVFFGELVLVVEPGDNIKERILWTYNTGNGRIILNNQVYEGTPDQLAAILEAECEANNILFSGTVSFGGYQYKSKMESMAGARCSLESKIESEIPIEGRWNDKLFQGKIKDVRKELTEYINSLPMVVENYDVKVGKSSLRTWDIGRINIGNFIEVVAKKLANRAIEYMKEH